MLLAIKAPHVVTPSLVLCCLFCCSSGAVAQPACYRALPRKKEVRFARAVSKRSSPSFVRSLARSLARPSLLFYAAPSSSALGVRAQWSRKNGLFALKSEVKVLQSQGEQRSRPKKGLRPFDSLSPSFRCAFPRLNVNDLVEVAKSIVGSYVSRELMACLFLSPNFHNSTCSTLSFGRRHRR